ncbi:MAG: pilus assembly protein [Bacillota bacterium]|nr:pilus assembly protein [Bacillota bacterium]
MEGKRIIKKKQGQAIVETALVLPIVLLILMGIIDFGLMFNNYLVLNNASREGARKAAVGGSDVEISSLVTDLTSNMDGSKLSMTIYPSESLRKRGDQVSVTVEYDNVLITPVISALLNKKIHLKAKTVMRVE